jgi:nucleoside-diphosphate-sugar epimerase
MGSRRTVLVTGAGGFIGGRVVEVLHRLGDTEVRAGVRRWAGAARIGRFPVDIVHCDIMQPDEIGKSLEGADAVVHCAVGGREVTVRGTENLLEAAQRANVLRFVHISTIDVYGQGDGVFDEVQPLTYTGREYGDSKIDAEKLCTRYVDLGLPVVVLRPTLVYGPFSASWTVEWAERLQSPPWLLSDEDCRGTCNLLYVDDLVGAVRLALGRDEAIGQTFNVNGPEQPSWNEYLAALNAALGLPPLRPQSTATSHLSARLMSPVRASAKFLLAHCGDAIKSLYERYAIAKAGMRFAERMIKKTPTVGEFGLLGRTASFPTTKAETRLGYAPKFSMTDGIALSVAWLRHHGYHRDGFE